MARSVTGAVSARTTELPPTVALPLTTENPTGRAELAEALRVNAIPGVRAVGNAPKVTVWAAFAIVSCPEVEPSASDVLTTAVTT